MNHYLMGQGAAYDQDGHRVFVGSTTTGPGRAFCSCGWLSDPMEYGRERKRAHRAHADEAEAAEIAAAKERHPAFRSRETEPLLDRIQIPLPDPELLPGARRLAQEWELSVDVNKAGDAITLGSSSDRIQDCADAMAECLEGAQSAAAKLRGAWVDREQFLVDFFEAICLPVTGARTRSAGYEAGYDFAMEVQ